jgi:ATP-dependent DNA ligase
LHRRFPLIVQAVGTLKARSCLIDGEAVCSDENGLPVFEKLRSRQIVAYATPTPTLCSSSLGRNSGR